MISYHRQKQADLLVSLFCIHKNDQENDIIVFEVPVG